MGVRHSMSWSFKLILVGIFILAFFLRTVNLQNSPPGFTWDEASLGYNAYSILKTGRDEWGVFLPTIFKSFGDYKPGAYVYLTIPFVAIFGLNETAVRLPSIIVGSLIPILALLIIMQLLDRNGKKIGLIVALLLCLSPWALQYSRGAWEANLAFFETLLPMYFFLLARKGKKIYLIL